MIYCGNQSFSVVWIDRGLSPCFYETVSVGVLSAFVLIFGAIELLTYRYDMLERMAIFILFSCSYTCAMFFQEIFNAGRTSFSTEVRTLQASDRYHNFNGYRKYPANIFKQILDW